MKTFIFSCGDPNGIGPEIILKSLTKLYSKKSSFIIAAPHELIKKSVKNYKIKLPIKYYEDENELLMFRDSVVKVIDIKGGRLSLGKATKTSGKISYKSLIRCLDLVDKLENAALITAPISKEAWELNKLKYEGHTELLGERYNVKNPLMLFYAPGMIGGLATIHKPISSVPKLLNKTLIKDMIKAIAESLKRDFNIAHPKIGVLGLNPHAGEKGRIGKEEIHKIIPAINDLAHKNINGPFVPDAFFGKKLYKNYHAVLGMYHDQLLIPFKLLNFDKGVNFTANLPIVRTSPDHGTAFNIAGKNKANPKSMIESIKLARRVLSNRAKR